MADKPKNPFMHAHDHDHDHAHHHHHDDEALDALDPGQQSLSDALRVSFNLLKGVMVLVVVVYGFTGIFSVDASEVAVRLQFGQIVGGETGDPTYGPGWHFGWPYPIEQKIRVPVATQRTVQINDRFWFQLNPRDLGKPLDELTAGGDGLNPERDGSLITGEADLVHAQFDVKYRITDPVLYVTHVGDLGRADALVRAAAEEGVIAAVARADTDSVLKKVGITAPAREHAQAVLDAMHTGITITGDPADPEGANGVILRVATMPLNVRSAYYEGTNAESERAQRVSAARSERTTTLNAAAGAAHDELFRLIQSYEYHHAAGDREAAEQVGEVLDAAFDSLRVNDQPIGGEAARLINEAKTYKTTVVEEVKGDLNTFLAYRDAYRANPALQTAWLWEQTREAIFSGEVETFYTEGVPYITVNRDPQVRRRKEQQRLEEARKQPAR